MRFRFSSVLALVWIAEGTPAAMAQSLPASSQVAAVRDQIIEARDTAPDSTGSGKQAILVKTTLARPIVRVEQEIRRDPTTGRDIVIRVKEMAADHVLVRLKPGKSVELPAKVNGRLGASVAKALRTPQVYVVSLPSYGLDAVSDAVAALKQETGIVEYAEPDYVVHLLSAPNDTDYGQQWGMDKIQAPQAWTLGTGSHDVLVGVIDTGTDITHPALVTNIWINQEELKIVAGPPRSFPAGLDAYQGGWVNAGGGSTGITVA